MDGAHIRRLQLTDFRSYSQLSAHFTASAVVLTGENGAGKTNLLEAVSFLTPGRGLRRATLDEVARVGAEDGFAIHASLDGGLGEVEIGTGTLGSSHEGGRRVRINGTNARSAEELLDWLRVIWLTPSMDALFTGPSADRRRFLDRLVLALDPQHGQRANDYEKAMRSRNRLLTDNVRDDSWFEAIEVQMAETGVAIAAARGEMVRLLTAKIESQPQAGPFPQAVLALTGSLDERLAGLAAVEAEEWFRRTLRVERERDRAAGRALDGSHRSDLLVRHKPKDMPAELCSTGEQKALLVGLVLAHARLCGEMSGVVPILLLDEIAAHFDTGRRAALFNILEDIGCQAFMTGTEPELFSSLTGKAQFLTVRDGALHPTPGH